MIMKAGASIIMVLALVLSLPFESKGEEHVANPSYVERIQRTAETMEVFPVDLIAREGPLSFFRKGSLYPVISTRSELNREAFERFYEFCQLAFDATPEDIDECVKYLPQASAKEKALIITVFYVYIYPWDKHKLVTDTDEGEKWLEAIKTQSWLSIQYPIGAFDLTTVKSRQSQPTESKDLLRFIDQYSNSEEIAFQTVVTGFKDDRLTYPSTKEARDSLMSLSIGDGIQDIYSRINLLSRKETLEKIRSEYPNSWSKITSDILFMTYSFDMFNPMAGIFPRVGNTSEKPKTLGQIAQQLLESLPEDDAFSKKAPSHD